MANFYPMYTEKSFKELATNFMKYYGIAQIGWSVSMNDSKVHLGECDFDTKSLNFSRVILPGVNNLQRIDTILHEVAHAIAGPHAEHGRGWQRIAKKLGALPQPNARIDKMQEYNYVWQIVCPNDHKYGTHHPSESDMYMRCPMPNCGHFPTWYKYGVALDTLSEYARV